MFGAFSKLFHKQSNFDFPIGQPPLNPQYWPKEWTEIGYKEYGRMPKIALSQKFLKLGNLQNAVENRHSSREFNINKEISFDELSTLLYYSSGVRPQKETDWNSVRRFYPSGGARYPLEIYLGVQRVNGLNRGIYHYNVKDNSLEKILNQEELDKFLSVLLYPWSRDAALILMITAVWDRNFIKYKDKGYRIVLVEAGHLAQNIALISSALNIGCCNSVGFHNEKINEILDIENNQEASVCMAVLGK